METKKKKKKKLHASFKELKKVTLKGKTQYDEKNVIKHQPRDTNHIKMSEQKPWSKNLHQLQLKIY